MAEVYGNYGKFTRVRARDGVRQTREAATPTERNNLLGSGWKEIVSDGQPGALPGYVDGPVEDQVPAVQPERPESQEQPVVEPEMPHTGEVGVVDQDPAPAEKPAAKKSARSKKSTEEADTASE